jgi:hypothetical protein
MSLGSTPSDTAGLADDDDLLLERLAALLGEIDPVPVNVIEAARATFSPRAEVSQPRRRGGAVTEPGLLGLSELLGPSCELDSLAGGAAADVADVPAGAGSGGARGRPLGTPASATKVDVHTA